jgi:hypothetical protein
MFLYSVTCSSIKEINKQFNMTLSDTDDVNINLLLFLNFNLIKNYFKSYVFSCTNKMIMDITFKFIAGLNMHLIFDYFYVPKKKQQLYSFLTIMMCKLITHFLLNIEIFYIDFFFLLYIFLLNFIFFYTFVLFF